MVLVTSFEKNDAAYESVLVSLPTWMSTGLRHSDTSVVVCYVSHPPNLSFPIN